MAKGKIFMNGRSQAIRLPMECRFKGDELTVLIIKIGDSLVVRPKTKDKWASLKEVIGSFEDMDDFDRNQPQLIDKREEF